jgi:hypothetical protein
MIHTLPDDMTLRQHRLRAVGAAALIAASGLPETINAYMGCAERCNGAYCWGEITPPNKVYCIDELGFPTYCITYYSSQCYC